MKFLKNLHLINEASLEALKMNLSSEETTAQVTGSLWPLNTITSEGSGTIYWTGEIKKKKVLITCKTLKKVSNC